MEIDKCLVKVCIIYSYNEVLLKNRKFWSLHLLTQKMGNLTIILLSVHAWVRSNFPHHWDMNATSVIHEALLSGASAISVRCADVSRRGKRGRKSCRPGTCDSARENESPAEKYIRTSEKETGACTESLADVTRRHSRCAELFRASFSNLRAS